MSAKQKKSKQLFKLKHFYYVLLSALGSMPIVSTATPTAKNPLLQYFVLNNEFPYHPRVTLNAQAGSYGFGQFDYVYPFLGRNDSIAFLDARYKSTTQNAEEFNLGLAYRRLILNDKHIAGGYIWADRARSINRKFYNQVSIGGEFLGELYDFRGNIYVPYGQTKQFVHAPLTPTISGHTVGVTEFGHNEQALSGADIEVGREVPYVPNLRMFADYYHFGVSGDEKEMNGGRARVEYYYNYNMTFTASYSYDNVRQGMGFFGVRLSLGGVDHPAREPMQGRMEDFIIRDVDIVTVTKSAPPIVTLDSRPYWFVDNAAPAGGDGTFEHPFNTEQEVEIAAGNGHVIYTFQGNAIYPLPAGGLNIKPNQFFTASGGDLTFHNVVILPATTPPILNGRINVASGATLTNFTLSGANSSETIGIYGNAVSNVTLSNLTVQNFSGTSANGVNLTGSGFILGIPGGVGGDAIGIQIQNSAGVNLQNVTVTNINGGSANGGDVFSTGSVAVNYAIGGVGGTAGHATGIDLHGSTSTLNQVTVTGINGGSANSGDGVASFGNAINLAASNPAGNGGNAIGIDLSDGNASLQNVQVLNVIGGSANGGDASSRGEGPGIVNYAQGATGGYAGNAIGLNSANAVNTLTNVTISNIVGGSANGGDASSVGSLNIVNDATGGFAGYGGDASGINLANSNVMLSDVNVSTITGGDANGGNARSVGTNTIYNISLGRDGFYSGDATGINLSNAQATLMNITINNISSGSSNGGDAASVNSGAGSYAVSYAGGGDISGTATGINLTNAIANLNHIQISNILGGSANGGNAAASGATTNFGTGGDGDTGGNAIGIIATGSTMTTSDVTFTNIVGGSANGGVGTTTNGIPGTPGTAVNIQP